MPRSLRVALICLGALLCLDGRTPAAEGPGGDRPAVLTRQRDHYLQSVLSLPPLSQHRMDEILQLRIEAGQLSLHTDLTPSADFEGRRANVKGMASPAAVTYVQFVANNPAARQFEFKLEEYPDAETYGQLHLQWQPNAAGHVDELSIERTEQTSNGFLRVYYHQGPTMARVLVFANDAATNRNVESFNFTERDFVTLRRLHPQAVHTYLRPILHRLGQDAVFAPEANVAWQVLAADWPVDERINDEITRTVPQLNDVRYRVRNDAADRLAGLGRDGASAILRMNRRQLSFEQNQRLDEIVSRFRQVSSAEAKRLEEEPDFLLDCVYCEDETIRTLAAARLPRVLGYAVNLDVTSPERTRVDAVDTIRLQLHPPPATQPAGELPLPITQPLR